MAAEENTPERWLAVVGYEGFYEVSDLGRVRSLNRIVRGNGFCTQLRTGRILRPDSRRHGYQMVMFSSCSVRTRELVHRVVLKAFCGLPLPGMQADHIDCDPSNNRLSNLRWVTPAENQRHSIAKGRRADFRGENHGQSRLTDSDVREIRRQYASGIRTVRIAETFGIHPGTALSIAKRRYWKHVE